ncbi:MAG: 2-oxoacid:acceptor oxidoreductase subunit alpha [Candidatus Muiribacteriota bacterium]
MNKNTQSINILLSGAAGQGIETIEKILSGAIKNSGLFTFTSKELMSRIRGGLNSLLIRISDSPKSAYIKSPDLLFSLKNGGINRLDDRISGKTTIFYDGNKEEPKKTYNNMVNLDMDGIKGNVEEKLFSNTAVCGYICSYLHFDKEICLKVVDNIFSKKSPKKNRQAFLNGYSSCRNKSEKLNISDLAETPDKNNYIMNGSQALGLGALAGGCNFISSYPMSPSTGVLIFLAEQGKEHGVFVEQAEDEISAINMCLGAWYAGARAIVTTSGGGFALMEEGLSLSGITETPCVIHVSQRPGPGTGLPTRTEQGDLNLVLYGGHGDFPRVILSPGNAEQCFNIASKAFDIADKFQVPVIILTDQFLVDSTFTEQNINIRDIKIDNKKYITDNKEDYKRYEITEDGISKRKLPGYGKGLVRVDSDEHNEYGEITEDFNVRVAQVQKRMNKLKDMKDFSIAPTLIGKENYKDLIVCWGSNYGLAEELIENSGGNGLSALHFSQIYPVPDEAYNYLKKAERIIILENNYTGQFGELLKKIFNIDIYKKVLKFDGLPLCLEETTEFIDNILSGGNDE